ncbi:MAG: hypothetical protein LBN39_09940 [Planctomycetaceae bacterium]|jgi:hypothetical protein|nr:hypothetical protein [Planctomycetaceae bacterium]
MGIFRKNKKTQGPPDLSKVPVLPNDLAEHTQMLEGLNSDEIIKLLEALGQMDEGIVVSRRRPVKGKNYSKEVGGRHRKMPVADAVEYEKKRQEERTEKEKQVSEMFGIERELFERDKLNDEVYPKHLSPDDIVRGVNAAKDKLTELDRHREKRAKIFAPKEEMVLDALMLVKKYEAARVAKKIAEQQRAAVAGKTVEELEAQRERQVRVMKGEPDESLEEREARLKKEEEERIEYMKTLPGFDESQQMLTDEAGNIVRDDVDAAAAVMRQWIGNIEVNN